jgi:hypothetical protein
MSSLLHSWCEVQLAKDGTVYSISSKGDGEPGYFFNSLSSVSVEQMNDSMMTAKITFTPPYQDAIKILTSGLLGIVSANKASPGNKSLSKGDAESATSATASVKFIRNEGGNLLETDKYVLALTQPDVSIDGSEVVINLQGTAQVSDFSLSSKEVAHKIKEGDTALDLLEFVSEQAALELDFEGDDDLKSKASEVELSEHVKKCSLYDMLVFACAKIEADFEIANTIRVTDSNKKIEISAVYEFVLWRQVDPVSGIFPMYNFHMEGDNTLFLSNRVFGTKLTGVDPEKKEIINEANEPEIKKGNSPVQRGKLGDDEGLKADVAVDQTPTYRKDPKGSAGAESRDEARRGLMNFIKVRFEVPGLPGLFPQEYVNVRIGDVEEFALKVRMTKVHHIWDSNGWTTEIEGTVTGGLGEQDAMVAMLSPTPDNAFEMNKSSVSILT